MPQQEDQDEYQRITDKIKKGKVEEIKLSYIVGSQPDCDIFI